MVLVLAIGDLCSPYGSQGIPSQLASLLKPGKIERVLCTGNLCDKVCCLMIGFIGRFTPYLLLLCCAALSW